MEGNGFIGCEEDERRANWKIKVRGQCTHVTPFQQKNK